MAQDKRTRIDGGRMGRLARVPAPCRGWTALLALMMWILLSGPAGAVRYKMRVTFTNFVERGTLTNFPIITGSRNTGPSARLFPERFSFSNEAA